MATQKIYVGQTKVYFEATVSQDVTAGTCLIKYIKPSGATGSWSATIITAATGVIRYTVPAGATTILDEAGTWTFWGHVTFADTRVADGEPYTKKVYVAGT